MICINTVLSNRIRMESKRNMETKLISLVLVDFGYQSSFVVKTSDFANEYRLSAAKYPAYPRKYHSRAPQKRRSSRCFTTARHPSNCRVKHNFHNSAVANGIEGVFVVVRRVQRLLYGQLYRRSYS